MRVLAATPPQCCLDLAWRPDGVSLRAVEVGSPGHIEEAELNGVDVLLLAGFHPGPDLLRDLTGLLGRFPAQRVAVVAADAADEFVSGLRRLGIVEIWPELSRRRLADLLGQVTLQAGPGSLPDPLLEPFSPTTPGRANGQGLTLGLMSAKGGDGGSFIAANLATALAGRGERVLILDLALPFGDVEMFLELRKPQYDLADFCEDVGRLDRELFDMMTLHMGSGLHYIPSLRALDRFGALLPQNIEDLVRRAASFYRFVLLDLGSGISPVGLDMMAVVDRLGVVVTPTVPSLRKAAQIIGIWERIGRDSEGVMLVGNRMARKWDLTVQELEAALQRPLSRALPNVPESVNQSVMAGLPLVQHASRSLMTQHMQSWADELAGRVEPRGKETLWQRLMNR